MSQYNVTDKQYRAALAEKMHRTVWFKSPVWSKLTGFAGVKDGDYDVASTAGTSGKNTLQPTGKVVEVFMDFQRTGGITMDIPVAYPLTGDGVSGDAQLLNNEEQRTIAYKTVAINQQRHGVLVRSSMMSEQILKKPETYRSLMKSAQSELTDWFGRWKDYNMYLGVLAGASRNLTKTVAEGGLGISAFSHPNFYIAGVGAASGTPLTTGYETSLATAIETLSAATTSVFNTAVIDAMCYYATIKRIPKIDIGGQKAYIIIISPSQMSQLRADSKWIAAQQSLKSDNPTLSGLVEGFYREAFIMVDAQVPTIYTNGTNSSKDISGSTVFDSTYSTAGGGTGYVQYGLKTFMATPVTTGKVKPAILLGASALACGYGDKLGFNSETFDYGEKKAEGAKMTVGIQRADVVDNDGYFGTANAFKENTSSLVCATYSPDTVSWT